MEELKPAVDKLVADIQVLYDKLEPKQKALKALREVCDHNWTNVGRDSHKDHYECKWCGDTGIW